MMTYEEAVNYLNSFIDYERKDDYSYSEEVFDLKRVELLLKKLGNPHKNLKVIHIAGSKGKGSVACFCASILKEAGFKTGLYTSPHLETFRERIRINDEFISKEDVVELTGIMKPHTEKIGALSFFEVYTAMAFLYFQKEKVDMAVMEVGLGGRLDATNVVNPLVCVITPISFEHTQKLGNTLAGIAKEKSGIIKKKSVVVSSVQKKEALNVIKKAAKAKGASVYVVGEDILYQEIKSTDKGQTFSVTGFFGEYAPLEINLLGEHQLINAASAIGAMEALGFNRIIISKEAIKTGLSQARWPGRIEVVGNKPTIVLDGAQNVASAQALAKTIKKCFSYRKLILILGVSKDKDMAGMAKILKPIADKIIITRANLPRAAESDFVASFFDKDENIEITQSVEEAVGMARECAKDDDLILICGSLFVVGEAGLAVRSQAGS